MSIFATVAIVCTLSTCNDYYIDTAPTLAEAVTNTQTHQAKFDSVWTEEKPLTEWLTKQKIGETVFEIVSLDLETQEVDESQIP